MRLGVVGRYLRRVKLEIVPGYPISLLDVIAFRRNLLGVPSPLTVHGRWRAHLAHLVVERHFLEAGLEDLRDTYPGKFDRQIMVTQSLPNVIAGEVEGDVGEFGCFRGHTAIQMAETMRSLGDRAKLYLFDSFEGFPRSEASEDAAWREGDLAADYGEVARRFEKFDNVEVVKGFFEEALPAHPSLRFKFAHVDVDLYTQPGTSTNGCSTASSPMGSSSTTTTASPIAPGLRRPWTRR